MLRAEWPGVYVPDDMEGLYEPEAGVLFSERIIQVYRELALHHGAGLMPYTTVSSIEHGVTGHVVHTSAGTFTAQNVLVASGAWIGRILPELASKVTPVRKPIAWFKAPADRYGADKLPAFIINNGGDEEYFGFPDFDGSGLKIGRHDGGHIPLLGQPLPIFGTFEEDVAELRYALDRFLPDVGGLVRGQVCLYERTSDERILLGEVPGRTGVWFAGGGSGHGFKFASVIGEAISLAMMKGKDSVDLDWQTFSLEGVL
jgi:glycine/D-amino acid oxidase-like deaminating enzyme